MLPSRLSLVALVAAALCIAPLSQASASSTSASPVETSAMRSVPQAAVQVHGTRLGRTDRSRNLRLLVSMKPSHQAALDRFLRELYDPASATYHHFLTPAAYTKRFFDGEDRRSVERYLSGLGFTPHYRGTGSTITFSGSVKTVEHAFDVTISNYRDARGRVFYSNDRTPALPADIASRINGVVGLSNSNRIVSHHRLGDPSHRSSGGTQVQPNSGSGCSGATGLSPYGAYTPNQFKTAYDFDALSGRTGSGQTVALYELDDYSDANISAYKSCFGLSNSVTRRKVDNGTSASGTGGQVEVELDIEVVAGMAPGSSIQVYEAPNNDTSYLDEYQAIADDNSAQIVSSSWGGCEAATSASVENSENTIFQQLAAQGQSLFVAAGDDGSEGCARVTGSNGLAVSDSAAQPYATGVGGTRLSLNSSTNAVSSEVTWNDYSSGGGAGGGGISSVWSKPSWQTGTGTDNSYSNGHREVPDVSADASPNSGYAVYAHLGSTYCGYVGVNGADCWFPIGGTSAAAPLWAAGAAVVNSQLAATSPGSRLGFLNPALFNIQNHASSTYRDITSGTNCYSTSCGSPPSSGAYPATSGYDQATGLGSLDLGALAAAYQKTTAVSLSASLANPGFDQDETFTAHAAPSIGSTVMSGTVTFKDGDTALATVNLDDTGTAKLTTSGLELGSHEVTAVFTSTNSSFYGNTSAPTTVTVVKATPTVTATVSPTELQVFKDQALVKATVSATGFTPEGDVEVLDGGQSLGTQTLVDGKVSIPLDAFTSKGPRTLTVHYLGSNVVDEGTTTVQVTVVKQTPVLKVNAPSQVGHNGRPTVKVTFSTVGFTSSEPITVRYHGKTYTRQPSDSPFSIKLAKVTKKGSYKVAVSFPGDSAAAAISKTVTIRVT